MVGGGGRFLTYVFFELLRLYTIDDKRTKYECPSLGGMIFFSTTNPIWIGLGLTPNFLGQRTALATWSVV
jgi:hypothetical protein